MVHRPRQALYTECYNPSSSLPCCCSIVASTQTKACRCSSSSCCCRAELPAERVSWEQARIGCQTWHPVETGTLLSSAFGSFVRFALDTRFARKSTPGPSERSAVRVSPETAKLHVKLRIWLSSCYQQVALVFTPVATSSSSPYISHSVGLPAPFEPPASLLLHRHAPTAAANNAQEPHTPFAGYPEWYRKLQLVSLRRLAALKVYVRNE